MQLVQFIGLSHIREISQKDFAGLGIDQGSIRVVRDEEDVIEVSDEAAEWLLANDKDGPDSMWKKPTEKRAETFRKKVELLNKLSGNETAGSPEIPTPEATTGKARR